MVSIADCPLLSSVTCLATDKISRAAKKLKKHQLRHLYVVDKKKKLLGIFSALDVVYEIVAQDKDYRKLFVKAVMNTDIVSFSRAEPLTKAIGFMSQTNVFLCPVVDKEKLIGVLAYKDAIAAILKQKHKEMQTSANP